MPRPDPGPESRRTVLSVDLTARRVFAGVPTPQRNARCQFRGRLADSGGSRASPIPNARPVRRRPPPGDRGRGAPGLASPTPRRRAPRAPRPDPRAGPAPAPRPGAPARVEALRASSLGSCSPGSASRGSSSPGSSSLGSASLRPLAPTRRRPTRGATRSGRARRFERRRPWTAPPGLAVDRVRPAHRSSGAALDGAGRRSPEIAAPLGASRRSRWLAALAALAENGSSARPRGARTITATTSEPNRSRDVPARARTRAAGTKSGRASRTSLSPKLRTGPPCDADAAPLERRTARGRNARNRVRRSAAKAATSSAPRAHGTPRTRC